MCCCKRKKTKSEKLHARALKKLDNDHDIVRIVDQIHKIKATLKVLVADNTPLIARIQKVYFDEKHVKPRFVLSKFDHFLEKDKIFELKQSLAKKRLKQRIFEALKQNRDRKETM